MKMKVILGIQKTKYLRSFSRLLGLFLILLTIIFAIPSIINSNHLDSNQPSFTMIFMGILTVGGLAIAWKWELLGAIISLAGFIGVVILNPNALSMPMFYLFPLTAILFLICWKFGTQQK